MSTPVNRLLMHYADAAKASTIDYIGYCFKRIYATGRLVTWHYREDPIGGEVHCGLATDADGHAYVVRFRVPVEAGGVKIKAICRDAADALDNMVLRITSK